MGGLIVKNSPINHPREILTAVAVLSYGYVAAIAEPPILTAEIRGSAALAIQIEAINWFERIPGKRRREENVQVLRKALGIP